MVAAYRVAKVSERRPFLAADFKRHRAGFTHIGDLWEAEGQRAWTMSRCGTVRTSFSS